jgi:adenine-specific DNA-methyltransferase
MTLKRVLIDLLSAEQLREFCTAFEIEADRRSADAMREGIARTRRAKPELMIERMTVDQLRAALESYDQPNTGNRPELVARLLEAGGRYPVASAGSGEPLQVRERAPDSSLMNQAERQAAQVLHPVADENMGQYTHGDQAVQRPDAGVQDQFTARKPPKTYRYDSSLDPALSWDEQPDRELGEWLIGLIVRAGRDGESEVFAEPQVWKGGWVRLTSAADAAYHLERLSKPFLNWAGKAERHELKVPTVPLFVHERHSTKAILDTIRHRKAKGQSFDLFGDGGMDIRENLEAYEHKGPWQNRMILGDSLAVMNSLLEYEGMAGQVQMIYFDPPYGVKFGSNFQPFVRKREVKHGDDEALTREPEMVKAYRDTWELGLHSYLTYMRDRIQAAKELLNLSGSLFVQISDDNLHHVTELLDEVFGADNRVSTISFVKTSGLAVADGLTAAVDYILWYARDHTQLKARKVYLPRQLDSQSTTQYSWVELPNGLRRKLTADEQRNESLIPDGARRYRFDNLTKPGPGSKYVFEFENKKFDPGRRWWGTTPEGMQQLAASKRLQATENSIYFVRFWSDFALRPLTNLWTDTAAGGFAEERLYVVQTGTKVLERCIQLATDPGDLVIDPTCGSGTTAYVAEQWGRRWITIDTSRVPLALARQRLLTGTFPYYELKSPQTGPAGGFVYKRKQNRKGEEIGGLVPHVTLKSIANDEQPAMEVLVDRPEEVSGVTRVAGPFVVEATVAPVQPIATGDDDSSVEIADAATHIQRMTEVLRQSKTLRLPGNRELVLSGVRRTSDTEYLHAEAKEGDKRVAVVFGPSAGAISSALVFESAREAYFLKFDCLYFFGFAIEPGARAMIEDDRKLRIPATYVAVTPDVAMSDLLKTTRSSEIFSITGLPDAKVRKASKKGPEGQPLYEVELRGLDLFDPQSMDTDSVNGESVPCWMLDTDYNGLCFYATQVFFPKTSAWDNLQRSLRATFEDSIWQHLAGTVSEPFVLGERRRVAVKVIDERGNELMRVLDVAE